MQTFLIVSNDKEVTAKCVNKMKKKLSITAWNLNYIYPYPSIGISEVRSIQQITSLKPYMEGNRLIVITDFQKATLEAQNAMLKLLEEPPLNNFFILTTDTPDKILPTIVSRSFIIKSNVKSDTTLNEKSSEIIKQILIGSAAERIMISMSVSKSREDVLSFLKDLTLILHSELRSPDRALGIDRLGISKLLKKIETARNTIERNVNFKAVLDILLLGFPKLPAS